MNAKAGAKSGAWNLMLAGYSVATVGLLVDLTTSGASQTPGVVSIGTAGLIGIGILLPAAGMLHLRRAVDRNRRAARHGLAMQALGLIGLLLGVLALQISSIPALFVGAALIVSAGASATVGGLLLRDHYSDIGAAARADVGYLVLGTSLIFIGVGVILVSEIGYYFVLSDVASTVLNDAGMAVSACGCVVTAYSSFVVRGHGPMTRSGLSRGIRPFASSVARRLALSAFARAGS
jgi:hypothetical protein